MTPDEEKLFYKLYELLKKALPYVERHWNTSAYGTGYGARELMNEIKALLGMK